MVLNLSVSGVSSLHSGEGGTVVELRSEIIVNGVWFPLLIQLNEHSTPTVRVGDLVCADAHELFRVSSAAVDWRLLRRCSFSPYRRFDRKRHRADLDSTGWSNALRSVRPPDRAKRARLG
ncbi:hypothetical protein SK803_24360 [Lentzea sp. BCCO 10_0856]|uniref:Uncharacterized protein n=1 Tax=Lentzea miocenica TaxID=3095431 RepID=A0ABU4T5C7_9PSEU|nr:hypothetical protein [Lentzea sp. BCCO 10_0856]MDX8033363.1 hypothetical protein [Lentzea sp. BCCO 10_0856]